MNIKKISYILIIAVFAVYSCKDNKQPAEWVSTTETSQWKNHTGLYISSGNPGEEIDAEIFLGEHLQNITGFGACFNELGWTSLAALSEKDRDDIMQELFVSRKGANFTICRMPVGANDFSRDWYSYNEKDGDLEMKNFSIANDEQTLIPFIKSAKKHNPDLKIWASPWSPPSWMKYNHHYACRPDPAVNDLKGDSKTNLEGTNMFVQNPEYMQAYALYFGKFIDAFRAKGINIFAVAPQNEFNSCQNFPSCTWTASGLTKFIAYLGPEMEKRRVEIMCGTMERPNGALIDTILNDPTSGRYIKSVGFQWAGKNAIGDIHERYPGIVLYQTEQECGDGQNDWGGAVYSWDLMKHYFTAGASVYDYWNISLEKGGISHWGWAQNSLVVVDSEKKSYRYSFEYYVMKHYSHYVLPGAKHLKTLGYDNLLAFLNTDGSIAIVVGNIENQEKLLKIKCGDKYIQPKLSANSFNTLLIRNI